MESGNCHFLMKDWVCPGLAGVVGSWPAPVARGCCPLPPGAESPPPPSDSGSWGCGGPGMLSEEGRLNRPSVCWALIVPFRPEHRSTFDPDC